MKIKVNPRLLGNDLPDLDEGLQEIEVESGITIRELLLDLGYDEASLGAFKIIINGRRRDLDYELKEQEEILAKPVSLADGGCACST